MTFDELEPESDEVVEGEGELVLARLTSTASFDVTMRWRRIRRASRPSSGRDAVRARLFLMGGGGDETPRALPVLAPDYDASVLFLMPTQLAAIARGPLLLTEIDDVTATAELPRAPRSPTQTLRIDRSDPEDVVARVSHLRSVVVEELAHGEMVLADASPDFSVIARWTHHRSTGYGRFREWSDEGREARLFLDGAPLRILSEHGSSQTIELDERTFHALTLAPVRLRRTEGGLWAGDLETSWSSPLGFGVSAERLSVDPVAHEVRRETRAARAYHDDGP